MAWDDSVAIQLWLLALMAFLLAMSPSMYTAAFFGYAFGALVYAAMNARHDREMGKLIDSYVAMINEYHSALYGDQK